MATPAASVNTTMPPSGAMPISTAPVAPAKPTWESAWPAKVWPRATRKDADDAGDHRDDAARRERGQHEVVVEHAHG